MEQGSRAGPAARRQKLESELKEVGALTYGGVLRDEAKPQRFRAGSTELSGRVVVVLRRLEYCVSRKYFRVWKSQRFEIVVLGIWDLPFIIYEPP